MPLSIGGSRAFPTENQPLSYAQQYSQMPAAAAPPTNVYAGGYQAATNPNTPTATIGGGQSWNGPAVPQALGNVAPTAQGGYFGTPAAQGSASAQGGAGGSYGPNVIGNNLPFDLNASGNMMNALSADPATTIANIGPAYKSAYDDYLKFNMAMNNNITAGYGQTAQNQWAGQQGVIGGYNNLSHDVLGGIAGIGSDQLALINRNYAGQAGTADQNLINSGLGNSTVRSSVQRGIGLDQSLAQNNLANSIAQTRAGFQSNLGLAGLNYQGNAVRDNTNLSLDQLHWMNTINAPAPNAGLYGQIAQQAGAALQSNANRAQIDRLASQNTDLGAQVRQAAILGGSGGMSPGTGGQLPPSIVRSAGAQSAGMGTSGFGGNAQGSFQPMPGYGGGLGGGQFQNANSGSGSGGGFGGGLRNAPGVTNLMGNSGPSGAAGSFAGGSGLSAGVSYAQNQQQLYDPLFGFNLSGGQQQQLVDPLFGFDLSGGQGGYIDQGGEDYYGNTIPESQPQGFFDPFFGFDMNQSSMSGDMSDNGGDYSYGDY